MNPNSSVCKMCSGKTKPGRGRDMRQREGGISDPYEMGSGEHRRGGEGEMHRDSWEESLAGGSSCKGPERGAGELQDQAGGWSGWA
jgi:hypothetical protein